MEEIIEMRGSVVSILFGPSEDGYTMISLTDERGKRIVAAGRAVPSGIQEGDEISFSGKWRDTPKGPLIAITKAKKSLPRTDKGVVKWLTRAKIPSIGPTRAQRLVDRFGIKAIDAIASGHEDVVAIIGRKAAPAAIAAIVERRDEAEVGAMLAGYDIGTVMQKKIQERYKDLTRQVLTTDPYRLIIDLDGVAFLTADKIAQSAGMPANSPSRIKAGIIETLRQASNDGHCALYQSQLIEKCRQMLYVDEASIVEQIAELAPKKIVEATIRGMRGWALARINKAESELARHIVRKLRDAGVPPLGESAIEEAVAEAEKSLGLTLNAQQRAGAIMALRERLSILTGGPGTGKTHTLKVICEAWKLLAPKIRVRVQEQREFALAAPTGKASKRITETTGYEAKTIHRLLEYKPDMNGFDRNQANPLMNGMICIDESSMPDTFISLDLARAWGEARVLFIGDIDQLPSVGPGKVLSDMLETGHIPHTRLTEIYRQAAGSDIAVGADEIRNGRVPATKGPGESDLVMIEINDNTKAADRIVEMYTERMPKYLARLGLDPASIQVLCPGKQNEVGTNVLNRRIQEKLQSMRHGLCTWDAKGREVRVEDKVFQDEDDARRGLARGDVGIVRLIDSGRNGRPSAVHVEFSGHVHVFHGETLQAQSLHASKKRVAMVGLSDKAKGGIGDRVIQLENDYDRNIFNGDTGVIIEIEVDLNGNVTSTHVDFGGSVQSFMGANVNNLALSYALTIHKSQGSEYAVVIIPVTTSHYTLLRRPLIYTGTTRAKRICVYVGTKRALQMAISREDATTRITTLADAINAEMSEYA